MAMFASQRTYSRFLCLFCVCAAARRGAGVLHRPHIQNVTVDGATLIWRRPKRSRRGGIRQAGRLDQKPRKRASEDPPVRMTGSKRPE